MFQVLVMGGIALVAPVACGSRTGLEPGAANEGGVDAFPSELGIVMVDAFPMELPGMILVDAGMDAGADATFPSELAVAIEAGAPRDAGSPPRVDSGFPIEA